jgi:hypothetical protein
MTVNNNLWLKFFLRGFGQPQGVPLSSLDTETVTSPPWFRGLTVRGIGTKILRPKIGEVITYEEGEIARARH